MHESPASDAPPARRPTGRRALTGALATVAGLALLGGLSSSMRAPSLPFPFPSPVTADAASGPHLADGATTAQGTADGTVRGTAQGPAQDAVPDTAAEASTTADTPAEAAPALAASESATPFAQQDAGPGSDPDPAAALAASAAAAPPETPRVAETVAPQIVPLPVPRPTEFRAAGPRTAARRTPRRVRAVAATPAPAEDDRSFFEKFFGIERAPAPALAYAALETKPIETAPRRPLTPLPVPPPAAAAPAPEGGVAVYDITARTVTLPSGERLEAHSGLGEYMDDPRYVDQRMRGATPPGTYDLTEREDLFHGVRAIRLTPVGGPAAVHNRVGLLAHTYMLGPKGASNGCVSFRDYNRFLQAYLGGQIQRLVVVSGARDPGILSVFASR